ncbi:hypothetical protein QQ045_008333 [Rhodiola kirilowii]
MVISPPVRPPRITQFLKQYVLKMHFTNNQLSGKSYKRVYENQRDVAAAAKIGKILAERLLQKNIPAVTVILKRGQKYHGKMKAVIDSIVEAGVKLI